MKMRMLYSMAVVAALLTCGCGEKRTAAPVEEVPQTGVTEQGTYAGESGEAGEHTGGGGSPTGSGGGSPTGPGGGSPTGPG